MAESTNPRFDIYDAYHDKSHTLPAALAAVSALTAALKEHRLTTASEAISLLSNLNKTLKYRLKNPTPASAGTDAFLQYLVTTVARPSTDASSDFGQTVEGIIVASEDFVHRGLLATTAIAKHGRRLIRDGFVVLLPSLDDALFGLLQDAATNEVNFRVVLVEASNHSPSQNPLAKLEELDIPIATVPPSAVAHTLSILSAGGCANVRSSNANNGVIVIGSASAVLSNGNILAPMGTLQTCMVAQTLGIPTFIVGETWRAARLIALPGEDISGSPHLDWSDAKNKPLNGGTATVRDSVDPLDEPMDITPSDYITGIVTEHGVRNSAALSEESIKIWF